MLVKATRKNASLRAALGRWIEIVAAAESHSVDDVHETFLSADGVVLKSGAIITVFNVGGNNFRVLTMVFYRAQRVYVAEVLTHAEYSKDHWKDRL